MQATCWRNCPRTRRQHQHRAVSSKRMPRTPRKPAHDRNRTATSGLARHDGDGHGIDRGAGVLERDDELAPEAGELLVGPDQGSDFGNSRSSFALISPSWNAMYSIA